MWALQRAYILMAPKCKKPANYPADCMPFLKPMIEAKGALKPGRGEWEKHEKAAAEALGAINWLVVDQLPHKEIVNPQIGASDFWANKIRVEFKGKSDDQIAYCDALKKTLVGLEAYVKEHHKTGLLWGGFKGMALADYKARPPAARGRRRRRPRRGRAQAGRGRRRRRRRPAGSATSRPRSRRRATRRRGSRR